ncbi:MAG: trypsin-like peptidase domain-containing protein [Gemmataceae bacterium]
MRSRLVLTLTTAFAAFHCITSVHAGDSGAVASLPRRTAVVEAVQRVQDAVVNIHSERSAKGLTSDEYFALMPSQSRINGMGTGIIIDPRGYIITNHHVVEDVNLIKVRLSDGTNASARVLARDSEQDLALLKIDVDKALPVMPLGTSSDLMVGETVVAIGNAFGYEHTVSVGIISAIKRDVVLNKEVSYKSLIQTDASINPGNSGGPLLNVNGELIGVNVAIRAGAHGIAFAIPVDTMIHVAGNLMASRARPGLSHGIAYHERIDKDSGIETNSKSAASRRRLIVDRIEAESPAALAKLQKEDGIQRVGDSAITCGLELERALLDRKPGEHIPLTVRRDGKEMQLDLTIPVYERATAKPKDLPWSKLGIHLQTVRNELVTKVSQPLHGGVAIVEVRVQSPASKAGIQKGDILVGLHSWEMLTPENVTFVLSHPELASFKPLRFYIIRDGQVHRGWLQELE